MKTSNVNIRRESATKSAKSTKCSQCNTTTIIQPMLKQVKPIYMYIIFLSYIYIFHKCHFIASKCASCLLGAVDLGKFAWLLSAISGIQDFALFHAPSAHLLHYRSDHVFRCCSLWVFHSLRSFLLSFGCSWFRCASRWWGAFPPWPSTVLCAFHWCWFRQWYLLFWFAPLIFCIFVIKFLFSRCGAGMAALVSVFTAPL